MKAKNIIICKECGKECVRTSNSQKVCVDCRKKVKYGQYCKSEPQSTSKKGGRKKKALSIVEICELAKAEGLTYGQYVTKYGE